MSYQISAFVCLLFTSAVIAAPPSVAAGPSNGDPRLREITYDPHAVVTIPTKRGVLTLVVLGSDERITDVAAGLGGDCTKLAEPWCIVAQAGGRILFVKAKSTASAPNNLAVITDRRTHSFHFNVLARDDPRLPLYGLVVKAPAQTTPRPHVGQSLASAEPLAPTVTLPPPEPSPQAVVAERLQAKPQIRNTRYSLAEGADSTDIVPTLVFDDGRFTYLRFPGNREVPAVFHVLGDGTETIVNTRMEDDLLVVDRVSRHLTLRAGSAVVGIWNDAFDLDGVPPQDGTTAPGVVRTVKTEILSPGQTMAVREVHHE